MKLSFIFGAVLSPQGVYLLWGPAFQLEVPFFNLG